MYISKEILFYVLCIFALPIWLIEGQEALYAITAPKIIRPKADYNIIVHLHGLQKEALVTCTLQKTQKGSADSKTAIQTVTFNKDESTRIINLQIDTKWSEGEYTLNVTGTGGITFHEKIDVNYVYKQFVILVQSDKAIYKPGQKVLFRILLLDDNLKPVEAKDISDMKIYIIDPLDNKLRIFLLNYDVISLDSSIYGTNKFNYSNGVTNDIAFELHDEAMPGDWKIQAVTRGQIQNYTFFVDYYQLPLANVTITLPDYVIFKDHYVNLKVDCFYTFGKPVNGIANILMSKMSECGNIVKNSTIYSLSLPIKDGQLNQSIDLRDSRLLNENCAEMKLNVTVIVNDSITQSFYKNFETLDVYQQDLRAQQITKKLKFRPGKVYAEKIKIESQSGSVNESIIQNVKIKSIAKLKNQQQRELFADEIYKLGALISFNIPTNSDIMEIHTSIFYNGLTLMNYSLSSYQDCSETFVEVKLQEPLKVLKVGEANTLLIRSNEPIREYVYYIVIRGSIVKAELVKVSNPSTDNIPLSISLTRDMVPEVTIAVFYASASTGTMVSDSVTMQVTGLFHNEVNFEVKTPIVDAGQKANIIIETEPDSPLFLLGVDEAVLALKQGNDIIEKRVLTELSDNYGDKNSPIGFIESGMIIRTNAKPECKPNSYYSDLIEFVDDPDDKAGVNHANDNYIRKDFRETWIWERIDPPHGKKRIGIAAKVPDSITSWRLTAFSISSEKGLGLTKNPGHVTVFRPFFIKLNLPFSIKRKEKSEIHILAFNYLNQTSNVNINVVTNNTADVKDITLNGCDFKLEMKPNEIKTFTCSVTAKNIGEYGLKATAMAERNGHEPAQDGEIRLLNVIYEGIRLHKSEAVYFDFTKNEAKEIEKTIKLDYPKDAILESRRVFASATSELITTTWKDSLKNMLDHKKAIAADFTQPNACCFQRTVAYFPKIYWLDFLVASKKATQQQKDMAAAVIQKTIDILCFQNPRDGSFVSWAWHTGETFMNNNVQANSAKSSVWMTAYTLKLMNTAKNYVRVSNDIIDRAKDWLKKVQIASGQFIETDPEHQVINTGNFGAYLTSFVFIALNSSDVRELNPTAVTYLAALFPSLTNPYDIVITCYALHLAEHQLKEKCYEKVLQLSKVGTGVRSWSESNGQENLEITSYALMILVNRKSHVIGLEVFNYLLSKQSDSGWFSQHFESGLGSSLTTIICTEALTLFIRTLDAYDPQIESIFVDYFIGDKKNNTIHIKPENEILQSIELPSNSSEVKLSASGFGRAVARIYWEFNYNGPIGDAFNISANKNKISGDEYIYLDVCTQYNFEDKIKNAIMEIDLPTGYTYHKNSMKEVSKLVDRIEPINGDTHINVYLKEITEKEVCVRIPAVQSFKVENTQPLPVKVYPYYDRSKLTVEHWDFDK